MSEPVVAAEPERMTSTLASYSGVPPGNIAIQVGGIGFFVDVPVGGAQAVAWSLRTTGSTVSNLSWVEGPGCSRQGLNEVGQTGIDNELHGTCDDLPEGRHAFSVRTPAAQAGFTATITGQVLPTQAPNVIYEP